MKPKAQGTGDLNGFLDAGSEIEGELRFEDTFRIDGRLSGKVTSEGELVVGSGGEAAGELRVGTLYVTGTVRGTVHASRRVEIVAGARVEADVATPALVIEEGAHFHGRCSMDDSSPPGGQRRTGGAPEPWPGSRPGPLPQ